MVTLSKYNFENKTIQFRDGSFLYPIKVTIPLDEALHWVTVPRKEITTRTDFILSKIRRMGGAEWIEKRLEELRTKDGRHERRLSAKLQHFQATQ